MIATGIPSGKISRRADWRFKKQDMKMYMPMFIPRAFYKKKKTMWKFAPGGVGYSWQQKAERLCVRPTSEPVLRPLRKYNTFI